MLPTPSVARYQRKRLDASPRKKILETLTRRSRLTNLGVFLLVGLCILSLFVNLHYWSSYPSFPTSQLRSRHSLLEVDRPDARKQLDHLILVPCHGIWKGTTSWTEGKDWVLESYQTGKNRLDAFYKHIAHGAQLAREDPYSLLIFSGGQTKSLSSTTEAESYLRLAQTASLLTTPLKTSETSAEARATTENYAMDSYQNLLFSISRFHEFTGHFPSKISVVGYDFKRARFTELHREAIRWPKHLFNYIGIDPDHDGNINAIEGEKQNGFLPFTVDKYGCHTMLVKKRRQRNPFSRFHPYHTSTPEISPLLDWCPGDAEGGEDTLFAGELPWDRHTISRDA